MKLPAFLNRLKRHTPTTARITEGTARRAHGSTVIVSPTQRFGIGLADYMAAISAADDVDYKRTTRLYDIYADTLLDPHLYSVLQKRKSRVLGDRIEFRRDGRPVPEVNSQINSPWFMQFLEDAIDAQFWGFTLVQFFRTDKGWIDYYMVPRKHVDIRQRLITTRQADLTGTPFDQFDDLLLVRGKEPLGLLARTAPYVIWKRGSMGDWAQYSELFGMPTRVYTYDAADPQALADAMEAAASQGGASVVFRPEGANLEFVDSGSQSASSELYSTFVERCNAEISKAVLGNTLTTEAGTTGTQALGTVHDKAERELAQQDRLFLLNLLNYDMTDIFASLGIDTRGGEFLFVEPDGLTPTDRLDILRDAATIFHLPMSDDYLYEQLSIEKPADYDRLKKVMSDELRATSDGRRAPANKVRRTSLPSIQRERLEGRSAIPVFRHAPLDGASEW